MRTIAWRWWCLFAFAASLLLLASFYFDADAQVWIAQHQSAEAKGCMRAVSHFGDWPGHIALGLVLLALAWWRGSKKWTRIFLSMLIALAIAGVAGRMIKISTGRARPSVKSEEAWNGPRFSSKYHAFPSGHVAASTAFFATLALACWRIGTPFLVIPLLIACSRMYIGAHYLSDVICASFIGLLAAYFVARWLLLPIENLKSEI